MKQKVPIQKWMMFVDKKKCEFYEKSSKKIKESKPQQKKFACGAIIQLF